MSTRTPVVKVYEIGGGGLRMEGGPGLSPGICGTNSSVNRNGQSSPYFELWQGIAWTV